MLLAVMCLQVGLAQYTLRQYDAAEASFEAVRARDPYRLSCMDTYSNILYVKVCVLRGAALLPLCAIEVWHCAAWRARPVGRSNLTISHRRMCFYCGLLLTLVARCVCRRSTPSWPDSHTPSWRYVTVALNALWI
jgi:hypothetical protein